MNEVTLDKKTLDMLADAVAKKVSNEIRKNDVSNKRYLSAKDIAILTGHTPISNPVRKMIEDPTFPKPFSFGEDGRKRWDKFLVLAWIEARRKKQISTI